MQQHTNSSDVETCNDGPYPQGTPSVHRNDTTIAAAYGSSSIMTTHDTVCCKLKHQRPTYSDKDDSVHSAFQALIESDSTDMVHNPSSAGAS